jgi:hypothetical protein
MNRSQLLPQPNPSPDSAGAQEQLSPISEMTFGLLSKKSLAKISAASAGAVAELLAGLSLYWESLPVTMAALKQHDPAELMGLFEPYAEVQFDAYAEELLSHFSDVDLYVLHLATNVMDRISNEIRPASGFMPRNTFSGDWTELARLLQDSPPEAREEVKKALSDPTGDWEIYIGRTFRRHLLKHRYRGPKWDDAEANKAVRLLTLLFQLKYQFHLRLFTNWHDFDLRMRAHLSNRLAHWEAQAYNRAIARADETVDSRPAPILVMSKSGTDRRAEVDRFISNVRDAGRKITRKDIWTGAGYQDATEFERFQRGDERTTKSAIANFNRVLNTKPEDFIRALQKKTGK